MVEWENGHKDAHSASSAEKEFLIHRPKRNFLSIRNKICITSQGKDLEAEVDPNFGRARYFLIMDPETMDFEAVENLNIEAAQGAGIQSAQLIANKNVKILLTGNCGPNAQQILQSSGIEVITGASGNVRDVLLKFRSKVK